MTNPANTRKRSPYWLSPGIDVPTRDEILPGMRRAKDMFFICEDRGDAAFVPNDAFMTNSPTWRLDVLGDILEYIQLAQEHAAVDLFRELTRKTPKLALEKQLEAYHATCNGLGLVMPENVDALIVLDRQFTDAARAEQDP